MGNNLLMINVWISTFSIYIMLCGFYYSYLLSYVNRTILLLPRGIFENAIRLANLSDDERPYFDNDYLEHKVISYFNVNLKGRVTSYDVSFCYFNVFEKYAESELCDGVLIGFRTSIIFNIVYTNTLAFSISSNE